MKLAWTELAKAELAEIRRYSIARWGPEVAARCLGELRDAAKASAAHPERLRIIQGPYYLRRVGSHYLVLHVDAGAGRVTVARILHVRMDIERHLPPPEEDEGYCR